MAVAWPLASSLPEELLTSNSTTSKRFPRWITRHVAVIFSPELGRAEQAEVVLHPHGIGQRIDGQSEGHVGDGEDEGAVGQPMRVEEPQARCGGDPRKALARLFHFHAEQLDEVVMGGDEPYRAPRLCAVRRRGPPPVLGALAPSLLPSS